MDDTSAAHLDGLKARAVKAFRAALDALSPDRLVREALSLEGKFRNQYDLVELMDSEGPVDVFACGKAAPAMTQAALRILKKRAGRVLCIASSPRPAKFPAEAEWLESEHPLPGPLAEKAGRRALDWMAAASPDGSVKLLALLSGGTSALLGAPAAGLSGADLAAATNLLLNSGMTIRGINTVRKHLCPALGGGLLRALPPDAEPLVLLLSDVPGNDLTTIGSGPLIPDPSTAEEALEFIREYGLEDRFPAPAKSLLTGTESSPPAVTLKPGERPTPRHLVLADNTELIREVERQFRDARYTRVIGLNEQMPAADALRLHLAEISRIREEVREGLTVLVSGGELATKVTGGGLGGRNTHYALAFLSEARRLRLGPWVLLSAGSDGRDGPAPAAGAVTCSRSAARAESMGLDPVRYLERSDSCAFFEKLGELVVTGPTGNNLNDIRMVLLA